MAATIKDAAEVMRPHFNMDLMPLPEAVEQSERARIDGNFLRLEQAIVDLRKTRQRTPRPRRTGSAARINADDIRFFWLILTLNLVFAAAALIASFAGQYAMAPYTFLPVWLYWLVPLFIDLPLLFTSSMVLIFKRRGQSQVLSWVILVVLTLVSSTINVVHVLSLAGVLDGSPLTIEHLVGASIMGLAPILVLVGWEEIARLAVKPIAKEPPAALPKPTPKKK
jgi:Protein of unknown function (DUF2637)